MPITAMPFGSVIGLPSQTILGNDSLGLSPAEALVPAEVRTLLGLSAIAESGDSADLSSDVPFDKIVPAIGASVLGSTGAGDYGPLLASEVRSFINVEDGATGD